MNSTTRTAAVMPCYRTSTQAVKLAQKCLQFVDLVICVDDSCPQHTGTKISAANLGPQVVVLKHSTNQGVGGATKTGISFALAHGYNIIIKLDSDGQMNPENIPRLIKPLLTGKAQLCKGNRFTNLESMSGMPTLRLIGNIGLGFLTKLSTGYWELFDPTNGFIALSADTAQLVRLDKTDDRYFFETDLLFRCGLADIVICEIAMPSSYNGEISSLRPERELIRFSRKHLQILAKRIFYQYFLLDFNPGSIELVGGLCAATLSLVIALKSIFNNINYNQATPAGTQTLFLALTFIAVQLLLGFVSYDAATRPVLRRIKSTFL